MKNRKEKRLHKKQFQVQLKNAIFDNFENMTSQAIEHGGFPRQYGQLVGFFKNSIYSVQIYKNEKRLLLGIRRHDEKPICPWIHKQKIKNIFLGESLAACEFFPPESEKVDQANIYWIFSNNEINELFLKYGGI